MKRHIIGVATKIVCREFCIKLLPVYLKCGLKNFAKVQKKKKRVDVELVRSLLQDQVQLGIGDELLI